MKRIFERIIEGIIQCSGFLTSIVVLLIIAFLFTEAFGLFNKKTIEDGYVLAFNENNTVKKLNASQIKDIFDEEILNWEQLGGPREPITVFRLNDLTHYFTETELGKEYEHASTKIDSLIHMTPGMIAFIPEELIPQNPKSRI